MSVSLYYTARRQQPITRQEEELCRQIGDRYDARYPYGELYEGFCIYDLEQDKGDLERDVIFSGATKLSPEAPELVCQIANWWLDCLEEITKALPGAGGYLGFYGCGFCDGSGSKWPDCGKGDLVFARRRPGRRYSPISI